MLHRFFLLLFPFCAFSAEPFRVRLAEDLGTLDWNYGELNPEIVYQLMEGLFRIDSSGRPQPAAAAGFSWNRERTELKLTLRKDRRWSDGRPLCAAHFADSWDRLRSRELASGYAHFANILASYTPEGCRTLRVRFTRPSPEAPALFSHYVFFPLRREQPKNAFTSAGKLLVNGPYLVEEWKANVRMRLLRNARFGGTPAKLRRLEFLFIPEDATAKLMFDRNELDWMRDVPQLLRSPELERSPEFRVFPTLTVFYFGLNAGKSRLLGDPAVRELLSRSLERSELAKVLGAEHEGALRWLPAELGAGPLAMPPFAEAAARERLQAAAREPGFDLKLRVYAKSAHKLLAEWAQGQWRKKLGVNIPVEVQDGKAYWKQIAADPAPIFLSGVTAPYAHPRAFFQEFLTASTANWTGWSSPEYDLAVEQARFEEAEKLLAQARFVIPLYRRNTVALVKRKWKGFRVNPLGQVDLSRVGE